MSFKSIRVYTETIKCKGKEYSMVKEQKFVSAPCGLYCGACTLYTSHLRGDKKRLKQIAEDIATKENNV